MSFFVLKFVVSYSLCYLEVSTRKENLLKLSSEKSGWIAFDDPPENYFFDLKFSLFGQYYWVIPSYIGNGFFLIYCCFTSFTKFYYM